MRNRFLAWFCVGHSGARKFCKVIRRKVRADWSWRWSPVPKFCAWAIGQFLRKLHSKYIVQLFDGFCGFWQGRLHSHNFRQNISNRARPCTFFMYTVFLFYKIMSLDRCWLAGAGGTWNKWDCWKWNLISTVLGYFNCVLCIIFGRIAYIVYDPHFKRRLLDPRIKCWQKPTLIHSVFYNAVKLQHEKS